MKTKSMYDIFKMSIRYTLLNKKAIITLGILIILKEATTTIVENNHTGLVIPMGLLMVLLYLYFVGFIGYFVEEVIDNPENFPRLNTKKILRKGVREVVFFSLYLALAGLAISFFGFLGQSYPAWGEQIHTVKVLIVSFINLFPIVAMINVFLHDEKIVHGFNVVEISKLIFNLRTSKFIWIVIISLVVENLMLSNFTWVGETIVVNPVNFILNLLIIPFLYIFLQFVKTIAILISNENRYREGLIKRK